MNALVQKHYKAVLLGGMIMLGITILLLISETRFSIVDPAYVSRPVYVLINLLVFTGCWLVLASLLSKFSVYKVIGVVSPLILIIAAERYLHVSSNPLTIPLLILFWLGIAHLILPQFFNKYQFIILGVYGLVIAAFLFVYFTTPDFDGQSRERFARYMLIPIPVFAVLWGYEQWRWLRTLQEDKVHAELALLRSQINPHFFFNTLNNLYGLVVEKSNKAPEVVLTLSDMMRYTIYQGKEALVPLKDEIDYLENYIELHSIRYRKQVDISFTHEVDESIQVPPLLFIILLENAFKHGVEKIREKAFIHLHLKSKRNQLLFSIQNNYEETSSNEQPGIGLENLKKRLAHAYPNRHELRIEQTASLYQVQLTLDIT